jgi:pimeloyl-ACP methyl ester carboxylesterase
MGLSLSLIVLVTIVCCRQDSIDKKSVVIAIKFAFLSTHSLQYASTQSGNFIIIFENGLGHEYTVWSDVYSKVGITHQIIAYNRGGYGGSELGPLPRDLVQLAEELHQLKQWVAPEKKAILVGHSLGGAIIRTYSILYPDEVLGLVFVDPSHEDDLILTQGEEDMIRNGYSEIQGAMQESQMLIEDMEYLKTLPALPDIPITIITSMKRPDANKWYQIHESMGANLTQFDHLKTSESGHNIHLEEPGLVISAIENLTGKLKN